MHNPSKERPDEEVALQRAMTSIDPLLQASLQRDQQRRRLRQLLIGVVTMVVVAGVCALVLSMQSTQLNRGSEGVGEALDEVARAERADELATQGWQRWRDAKSIEAEELFMEASSLDPKSADIWNGLGWSRFQQGKFPPALEAFARCLKIDGDHGAALNGSGQALIAQGEYEEAEGFFIKAPDAPAAVFGLATVSLLLDKYGQAKDALDRLAKMGTGSLDKSLLKEMYDAAKAKKLPKQLRDQLAPTNIVKENVDAGDALTWNARGWQLFQSGKMRPAELSFRKALAVEPDLAAAKNGLGFCLLNQGKAAKAKPIFEELVQQNPTHAGFVNGLARCLQSLGKRDEAVSLWKTVESDDGPVTALTWGLAQTLTEMERFTDAVPYWERILQEMPDDAAAQAELAKCQTQATE